MFTQTIAIYRQLSLFVKMLAIALIFVLTSCPLKASIKQHVFNEQQTKQKNQSTSALKYAQVEATRTDCRFEEILNKGQVNLKHIVKIQPLAIPRMSFSAVFSVVEHWENFPEMDGYSTMRLNASNLIELRRLNL